MIKLISLLLPLLTSFYSLQFTLHNGQQVSSNSFQGKKVLIVNIASGSTRASQLFGLQQLYQQYGDSLAIVAFPSNSFGHEDRNNAAIAQFCQSQYGVSFMIAEKTDVTGTGRHPIYSWLADSTANGAMNGIVQGDFYKFLIDKQGYPIAIFAPSVEPMDSLIQGAILGNY